MPLGKDNRSPSQVTRGSGGGVAEIGGETYFSQSVTPSRQALVVRRQGPVYSFAYTSKEIRIFACGAVDLDFLSTAPNRLGAVVKVGRPPSEVFAALHMTRPTGASSSPASTEQAVTTRRGHTVLALAVQRGSLVSKLRRRSSPGMKAHVLRFVSTARPHRRFTPGWRTTASSQTAATALCCALRQCLACSRAFAFQRPH
jgi:hypothetical protein